MAIEIGTVLLTYFAEAGKKKRFVVIAKTTTGKYATALLINSSLTDFAKSRPHLRELNIPLACEARDYLDHDSFLACERMFTRETRYLENLIRQNGDCVLGKMSEEDLNLAREAIATSDLYSEIELLNFGIIREEDDEDDWN